MYREKLGLDCDRVAILHAHGMQGWHEMRGREGSSCHATAGNQPERCTHLSGTRLDCMQGIRNWTCRQYSNEQMLSVLCTDTKTPPALQGQGR